MVERLAPSDLPAAAGCLAAAFADYPLLTEIERSPHRDSVARAFAQLFVRHSLRFGIVDATACRGAAACWLPPGGDALSTGGLLRCGLPSLLFRLGFRGSLRFARIGRRIERLRRDAVQGPYWYLLLLGVHPNSQRRGLARRVLTPVLELADRDRIPCVLETQHEANLDVYRRLGFEVVTQEALTDSLSNWIMCRPPVEEKV